MAVFEDRYKPSMEVSQPLTGRVNNPAWTSGFSLVVHVVFSKEEEAKRLVRDAIAAGIFNDLGSGSNIDLCVITKGNVDYIRPHDEANKKGVRWDRLQGCF